MIALGQDTLNTRCTLTVGGRSYDYFSLAALESAGLGDISRLPYSLKVLLENLLRNLDGNVVKKEDINALANWRGTKNPKVDINYHPARVIMQDFTGVPAVVDLAAMRDALVSVAGDAKRINPQVPVDLVIDHSVMVDHFGTSDSFKQNVDLELV